MENRTFSLTNSHMSTREMLENQKIRLEIFKAAVASNLQIDDEFFPFMQKAFDFVIKGGEYEEVKKE